MCYAQSFQLCPTLCTPMDHSPPGSSVHMIFLARMLEWAAMPSCRGSSWPRDQTHIACVSCTAGVFFTTEPTGSLSMPPSPPPPNIMFKCKGNGKELLHCKASWMVNITWGQVPKWKRKLWQGETDMYNNPPLDNLHFSLLPSPLAIQFADSVWNLCQEELCLFSKI